MTDDIKHLFICSLVLAIYLCYKYIATNADMQADTNFFWRKFLSPHSTGKVEFKVIISLVGLFLAPLTIILWYEMCTPLSGPFSSLSLLENHSSQTSLLKSYYPSRGDLKVEFLCSPRLFFSFMPAYVP